MSQWQRRRTLAAWLWLALGLPCLANGAAGQPPRVTAPADVQAVETLTQHFFDEYQARATTGFLGLWEPASPRFPARAAATRKRFAAEEYEFGPIRTLGTSWLPGFSSKGIVYDRQAAVYLDVTLMRQRLPERLGAGSPTAGSWSSPDSPSAASPGRLSRCLVLVERAGAWRVWSYEATGDFVAEVLLQTPSAALRHRVLTNLPAAAPLGLVHLAAEHAHRGDDRMALIFYDAAQFTYDRADDGLGGVSAACGSGEIYLSEKKYDAARQQFQDALRRLQRQTAPAAHATHLWLNYVYRYLGRSLAGLGREAEAVRALQAAEDGSRVAHNWQDVAATETEIGEIRSRSHPLIAVSHFEAACHYYGLCLGTMPSADAYWRLGQCRFALDDYRAAQQATQAAADQYASLALLREEADAHCGLGRMLVAQGADHLGLDELRQARRLYQRALTDPGIAPQEKATLQDGLAKALISMAQIHLVNDQRAEARTALRMAIALCRVAGDRAEAILCCLRAQEIGPGVSPGCDSGLGWVLPSSGLLTLPRMDDNLELLLGVRPGDPLPVGSDSAAMIRFYERVLAAAQGNPQWTAAACLNLAVVDTARHADRRALFYAREAYQASEQTSSPEIGWRALAAEGLLHARADALTPAIVEFEAAIHTLESQRDNVVGNEPRLHYLQNNSWLYRQLVGVLVRRNGPGDVWAALNYSERIKGRLLLDLLLRGHQRPAPRRQDSPPRPVSLNTAARRTGAHKLGAPYEAPSISEATISRLQEQEESVSPLSPGQIQSLFPDRRSALIEFCFSGPALILFVFTPSDQPRGAGVSLHSYTVPREGIDRLANAFLRAVSLAPEGGQPDPDYYLPAHSLYEHLPAQVRAQIPDWRTLGIVPDGALWQCPFGALVTGFHGGQPHHLVENTAIFDAYSLKSLWETGQRRNRRSRPEMDFAGFGNVVSEKAVRQAAMNDRPSVQNATLGHSLDDPKVMPLVDRQLTDSLRAYESGGERRSAVFIGPQVTKACYASTATRARIVQLMTHGIYNPTDPMASYMRLSASPLTGRLSAADMLQTPLQSELMILAACDTGRGQTPPGEGLIGMTWAATRAGCLSILATQWQIPFDSTALLMRQLHRSLALQCHGKAFPRSKADIVRGAELQVLHYRDGSGQQPFRHPYFWAAFTLIGDGGFLDRRWTRQPPSHLASPVPHSPLPQDGARPDAGIEVGNGDAYSYQRATVASPGDTVNVKIRLGNTGSGVGRKTRIYFPLDPRLKYVPNSGDEFTKQFNINVRYHIRDDYIKVTKNGLIFAFGDMPPFLQMSFFLTFSLHIRDRVRFATDRQGDVEEALPLTAKCSFEGHVVVTRPAVVSVSRSRFALIQATMRMDVRNVPHTTRWFGDNGNESVPATPGDLVEFKTTIHNSGNKRILGGHIRISLPSGLIFAGKTKIYDNFTGPKGRGVGGSDLIGRGFLLPYLAPGNDSAATVTFQARVARSRSLNDGSIWTETTVSEFLWDGERVSISDNVAAEGVQTGSILATNAAKVSICANPGLNVLVYDQAEAGDLPVDSATVSTFSQFVAEGQRVAYRTRLANYGPKTLRNVIVCIQLPACSSLVPHSLRFDGTAISDRWALTKDVGTHLTDMAPGFSQELTFEVSMGDNLLDNPVLRPIVQIKTSTPTSIRFYTVPLEVVRY